MNGPFRLALIAALSLCASTARAERTHVVADGHNLGKIAKRYNVSIEAICEANGIDRRERIKPGQKLVIPERSSRSDGESTASMASTRAAEPHQPDSENGAHTSEGEEHKPESAAREARERKDDEEEPKTRPISSDGMRGIDVPGAGTAYYYEPIGPGRKSLRPVIMYLHGRGGRPREDCKRWAPVARRIGWVVCPSGPGARGDGYGWNNSWPTAHQTAMSTLKALRDRYGRRVQLFGNTIVGFSEGAYAALNVGVREPRAFNRWLILAGDAKYMGGPGIEALGQARSQVRRVYLITGEQDSVIDGTRTLEKWLRDAGVATRVSQPKDMGHEVSLENKAGMYRAALVWLDRGAAKRGQAKP